MIYSFNDKEPIIGSDCFIAPSADVIGDVVLGEGTSVWYGAVIRGDDGPIRIGSGSNVQDNAVLHLTKAQDLVIGDNVTIGHGAILHACTIEDGCLIGMGSIVLDGAHIGSDSLVAAGSLVSPNKTFPPRSLIMGSPAKAVRSLSDEDLLAIKTNTAEYLALGKDLASGKQRSDFLQ